MKQCRKARMEFAERSSSKLWCRHCRGSGIVPDVVRVVGKSKKMAVVDYVECSECHAAWPFTVNTPQVQVHERLRSMKGIRPSAYYGRYASMDLKPFVAREVGTGSGTPVS